MVVLSELFKKEMLSKVAAVTKYNTELSVEILVLFKMYEEHKEQEQAEEKPVPIIVKKKYKTTKLIKTKENKVSLIVHNDKPKIIFYVEEVLKEEKHILNCDELYEKVNKKFNETYTSAFSFQANIITNVKKSDDVVKKYKIGTNSYFGLSGWFDGDLLLKKYMRPDNQESDKPTEGYCEKCQQQFGNLAKHNEIRHGNDHKGKPDFPVVPNSMRN